MVIGKWFRVIQATAFGESGRKKKTLGRVIWVHPKQKFCVLEFAGGVRECFSPFELGVS